ncbi:dockerin type I domain-containing protein [Ruminococcus flavefaciens]|uniref:dockerin type I domain-containing protein n=1 Tax=Ruminococcus flavefaciens TaxID=1265 RepID=UPI000462ED44|nr:dockerin type I domain-containing protein [Ruminococcus flavefaciens]
MRMTKLLAAAMAIILVGGSMNYTPDNSAGSFFAANAAAATTAADLNLKGIFSKNDYYEFKQGSDNNSFIFSIELYDDRGTSAKLLKFREQIKEFEYDFVFDDKNVVVQKKELCNLGDFYSVQAKLKFPENTPLREYGFKIVVTKAIDKNGKDVTSKFVTYNGKYSILDKNGNDTGRPDPEVEIVNMTMMSISRGGGTTAGLAYNERLLTDKGYYVTGNINGKDHYFKEFDYDVELDDPKAVILEKKLSAEPQSQGGYFFYPTVKIKIPDDSAVGNHECKITIKKAIDLNGKDVTNKLLSNTLFYYYTVKSNEGTTPATTGKPSKGDPNSDGKINAIDASDVLNVYAKLATNKTQPTKDELACCDVNNDGKVNAVDASYVLSYYAYTQTGRTDSFADYMKNH